MPRTAILIPGFRSTGVVRVFPAGWNDEAARFDPQAIAATETQFRELPGDVRLTHAVVVMRR
jgi:hypothetical protein